MGLKMFMKRLFFQAREKPGGQNNNATPLFSFNDKEKNLIPGFTYVNSVNMYKSNPILAGCVNLNARTVSALPLKLFAYAKGRTVKECNARSNFRLKSLDTKTKMFLRGELNAQPHPSIQQRFIDMGEDFVEVEGLHPILQLLARGAAGYRQSITNGVSQTAARITDLQLTGNYYMQVVFEAGLPSDIWIVPAEHMHIEPYKTGSKLIKNYSWGPNKNNQIKLKPSEIIHGKFYNPDDLFYGLSPVEPAWASINWLKSLDAYQMALFANMGVPALFAKLQGATKDQLSRFESAYNRKMRGVKNSGKMLATSNDVDFIVPQFSRGKDTLTGSIDTSYVNKVTEIAFALGVPISKIMGNDANLASAFISEMAWHRDTISHICADDAATLNEYLLPLFRLENEVFLSYVDVVMKDSEKIETRLISLANAGILSKAVVRTELGYGEEDSPEAAGEEVGTPSATTTTTVTEDGEQSPRGSNFSTTEDEKANKNDNEDK